MKQDVNAGAPKTIDDYLEMMRFLNDMTDEDMFVLDLWKKCLYFSPMKKSKYNLPKEADSTCHLNEWLKVIYPGDLEGVRQQIAQLKRGERERFDIDYRILDAKGNKHWVNCVGKSVKDENGKPVQIVGKISFVVHSGKVDLLTGLLNKDALAKNLEDCISDKKEGTIFLMGIDDFKNINIEQGRQYGNFVLRRIAEILENAVADAGYVYRMDGDRFAINMPPQSKEQMKNLYDEIKKRISVYCGISAGVFSYTRENIVNDHEIIQFAEHALECAKKAGKDTLEFFSDDKFAQRRKSVFLQVEMTDSVRHGCRGFSLLYQPQIDSKSYDIFGAEALLRYQSMKYGNVSPVEFVPILENTELICEVGMWVLQEALEQCKHWRKSRPEFHISVNMSYIQLKDEKIAERVLNILRKSGLPGTALTLELTESIQLQNYSYFNEIFSQWRDEGIEISVDDFGTGYSSLGYLKSLTIDEIKIDRCFVQNIQQNDYNYQLLRNIISLAHRGKIRTCCEGVETQEELKVLQKFQPELLQGYLFDKPCHLEELEERYFHPESEAFKKYRERKTLLLKLNNLGNGQFSEGAQTEVLETLVNKTEYCVYISDVETHEMYFMNEAACKLTGVSSYEGRKCYEIFNGKDEPCDFCTNSMLEEKRYYEWERENTYLGRLLHMKDKVITWKGRKSRIEVITDITEAASIVLEQKEKEATKPAKVTQYRYDDMQQLLKVGFWVLTIDENTGVRRLYPDELMSQLLGMNGNPDPETYYQHWYNRICPECGKVVDLGITKMISEKKCIQMSYSWNHPKRGIINVVSRGIRVVDHGGNICLEGCHYINSDVEKIELVSDSFAEAAVTKIK